MYGLCRNCEAFKLGTGPKGELMKQCRRHHPGQVVVLVAPTGTQVSMTWPQTDEDQGCCDFLPVLAS